MHTIIAAAGLAISWFGAAIAVWCEDKEKNPEEDFGVEMTGALNGLGTAMNCIGVFMFLGGVFSAICTG